MSCHSRSLRRLLHPRGRRLRPLRCGRPTSSSSRRRRKSSTPCSSWRRSGPTTSFTTSVPATGGFPITAARTYGARGVGIDIDPQRIKEATENLKTAGVGDKVRFLNQDLFTTNISEATVVTLYLLPSLNLKVLPKLNAELKPGTRIVSHAFDMGDIKPQQTMNVNGRTIYSGRFPIK